jgi:hypothetical protein
MVSRLPSRREVSCALGLLKLELGSGNLLRLRDVCCEPRWRFARFQLCPLSLSLPNLLQSGGVHRHTDHRIFAGVQSC